MTWAQRWDPRCATEMSVIMWCWLGSWCVISPAGRLMKPTLARASSRGSCRESLVEERRRRDAIADRQRMLRPHSESRVPFGDSAPRAMSRSWQASVVSRDTTARPALEASKPG